MDTLVFDFGSLGVTSRQRKPRVIYCSSTGLYHVSPWNQTREHEAVATHFIVNSVIGLEAYRMGHAYGDVANFSVPPSVIVRLAYKDSGIFYRKKGAKRWKAKRKVVARLVRLAGFDDGGTDA